MEASIPKNEHSCTPNQMAQMGVARSRQNFKQVDVGAYSAGAESLIKMKRKRHKSHVIMANNMSHLQKIYLRKNGQTDATKKILLVALLLVP